MVTPLPGPDEANLQPPTAAESAATARAIAAAVTPPGGLTDTQRVLLEALFSAMTSHTVALDHVDIEPESAPAALASVLADRNVAFRTRGLQVMLLAALVLRPLPAEVADRVEECARELSVDDGMVAVARRFTEGSLALAAVDFERNGYTAEWSTEQQRSLHVSTELEEP